MNPILESILFIEIGIMIVASVMGARSTYHLLLLYRISQSEDRLARAISRYFALVALTSLWFVIRIIIFIIYAVQVDWLRAIDGALVVVVLLGPTYIEWAIQRASRDG
jgi:hypothetical protein